MAMLRRRSLLLALRESRGLAAEAGASGKKGGDTEFVQRRRVYRDLMHQNRTAFAAEKAVQDAKDTAALEREKKDVAGLREARVARKRYVLLTALTRTLS